MSKVKGNMPYKTPGLTDHMSMENYGMVDEQSRVVAADPPPAMADLAPSNMTYIIFAVIGVGAFLFLRGSTAAVPIF